MTESEKYIHDISNEMAHLDSVDLDIFVEKIISDTKNQILRIGDGVNMNDQRYISINAIRKLEITNGH